MIAIGTARQCQGLNKSGMIRVATMATPESVAMSTMVLLHSLPSGNDDDLSPI